MEIVQLVVVAVAAIVGIYWWWRVAIFMDVVENRLRDLDRNIEKLTRGE